MADPDFDLMMIAGSERSSGQRTGVEYSLPPAPVRGPSERTQCLNRPFSPLSATYEEGSLVTRLLQERAGYEADFCYGAHGSEETLKSRNSPPRVLHLATHGYFCPETDLSSTEDVFENPLLYSGLVLAGANGSIAQDEHLAAQPPHVEDGILTSLEVSGLNLVGTELVVLSACQAGLGEIMSGEGVFGLRRSFQHAGAQLLL